MKLNTALKAVPHFLSIKHLTVIITVSVLALSLVVSLQPATANAATDFAITMSMDGSSPTPPTPVDVGQVLTYRIDFSCNSLTVSCGQLTITDVLDPNLTILGASAAAGY